MFVIQQHVYNQNMYCSTFYVKVPTLPGTSQTTETQEYLSIIEETLYENYKARPYWTKPNRLTSQRVKELYPDLPKWQQIYSVFTRGGTFCNELTERMGFDVCLEEKVDDDCNANDAATAITVQPFV